MCYFTYAFCTSAYGTWLKQYSENMKVLSWDKHLMLVLLFPVHWIQISCFTKKSWTNQLTEFRDLRGFHSDCFMSVSHWCIHSWSIPQSLSRELPLLPVLAAGVGGGTSQQSVQPLQAPSKVTESKTEKILLRRHPLCGHVLKFPGEDGCVEIILHRDYFGEFLYSSWQPWLLWN